MTHVGERIQAWHLAVVVGLSTIGMALVLYGNAPNDVEVPLLVEGTLPVLPPRSAGGGEVLLEVGIDELGLVEDMIVLTGTPPFTEHVRETVGGWRFLPAQSREEGTQRGRVLVVALYRPPALFSGTTAGEAGSVLGEGSAEIPYPIRTTTPSYPPQAHGDGQALLEIAISVSGEVEDVRVLRATPGFENPSLDAFWDWTFRPAQRDGVAVPAVAWAILGYPQPTIP